MQSQDRAMHYSASRGNRAVKNESSRPTGSNLGITILTLNSKYKEHHYRLTVEIDMNETVIIANNILLL